MDKTYRIEFRRVFLLENLPAPLTRASRHLQIFDNYLPETRLRLRSIRQPETKAWQWILQQRERGEDFSTRKISEIFLNEIEHQQFEIFEGREVRKNERVETTEIRKNRYFYEFNEKQIEIDLFLGELWGLILANIYFKDSEESEAFEMPPLAILEVTNEPFFNGENLIGKTFADVRETLKSVK